MRLCWRRSGSQGHADLGREASAAPEDRSAAFRPCSQGRVEVGNVALWPGSMRASTGRVVVYGCLRRRLPARRPCPRSHLPRPPWPPRWRPPERRRRRCRRPTVCVWWRRCNRFLTLVGPGPSSRSAIGASACSAGGDGRRDFVGGEARVRGAVRFCGPWSGRRAAAEKLPSELVQQVSRGSVEVFGVAVPGVAVGLAAVPPQPLPDRAQLVDRKPGHPGVGIGHRHAPIPWRCRAP
jgi:hypothetical protein